MEGPIWQICWRRRFIKIWFSFGLVGCQNLWFCLANTRALFQMFSLLERRLYFTYHLGWFHRSYSSEPGHVKITTHQLPISLLLVKITAVFLLDCTVTVGIVHLSLHPKVFSHLNPTESKQSPNTPLLLRSSSLSDIQHPGRSAIGLPSLRMGEKDNGLCARPGWVFIFKG